VESPTLKRTVAAYQFNFDKCGSCKDNWLALLANANCDQNQDQFIRKGGYTMLDPDTGANVSVTTNFTLTLHPALCKKLWYSCEDEDTEEFVELFGRRKSNTIRYIFKDLDASSFALLNKNTRVNMTGLSDVFSTTAFSDSAQNFGSAFMPKDMAEGLMPSGAENFCVAMGSQRHSLGMALVVCDGDTELCKDYPLHIEVGTPDCLDCLTSDTLKHNGGHVNFHGYEFCYSAENDHVAMKETAATSMRFGFFLFLGGTGANVVFQANRRSVWQCQAFSESLLYLLAGVLLGGWAVANDGDPEALAFDAKTFMFLLLPPIMLREGFCINRRLFFANLNTILLLAFCGTFITVTVIAFMILWVQDLAAGSYAWPALTQNEAFLYATVISAVDPVAVVSQFAALGVDPGVEILVVGESLVNDAVIIVMFKIWKEAVLHEQSAQDFDYGDILLNFCLYCIMSIVTGLFVGIISALYFRCMNFKNNDGLEMVLFLIMGYVSFLLAEYSHFSGILSTLVCGMFMAAYTERNLSDHDEGGGDESSGVKTLICMFAAFADEIVFIMTGMAAVIYYSDFLFFFSFLVLVMCLLARAVAVFPLVYLSKYFRREGLTRSQAVMLWWAGLRGAVAVALSVDIPSRHRHTLTACTCFVVFFTVAIQGGFSTHMLKLLKIATQVDEEKFAEAFSTRFQEGASGLSKKIRAGCQSFDAYLEPILVRTQEEKDRGGGDEKSIQDRKDHAAEGKTTLKHSEHQVVYSFCTVLILYSFCTVLILCCTRTVYSYCTVLYLYSVLILYSFCTVLILCCTHTVLYSYCTHTVLYLFCTILILCCTILHYTALYSYCTVLK
jgi:sodium/hydrogen exchanger 8